MEDLRVDSGPNRALTHTDGPPLDWTEQDKEQEYGPNGFDCDRCGALIECAPNPDRTTTYVADYYVVPGGSEEIVCYRCAAAMGLPTC